MRFRLIAWTFLAAIAATGMDEGENVTVDVWIHDDVSPAKLLSFNKDLVSGIFQSIGITVDWHTGTPGQISSAGPRFRIRVVQFAPASAPPDALASTALATGAITLYEDRVRERLRRAPGAAARVASAYVLAHELAHAMQGIARHSDGGILKAQWSNDDFAAMIFRRLKFTDHDVELIRGGLDAIGQRPA